MITDHERLTEKLCQMSVAKHYDAYQDIAWDSPEMKIDPTDPRWELGAEDPIGATEWYRSLPPETRARFGLHRTAAAMKLGWQFEAVLKSGLLEHAAQLPEGSTQARYVYHEIVEESQHTLMFMEFVRRAQAATPLVLPGLPKRLRRAARRVVAMGRNFPALFFIFVLGGEDPIDHVQRTALAGDREPHPLVKRIMQIHVTEEARHIAFARSYLRSVVPKLSAARRLWLSIAAPVILGFMGRLMLRPGRVIIDEYKIPQEVIESPGHRARVLASLAKVRELCQDLGLLGPTGRFFWKTLGIAA